MAVLNNKLNPAWVRNELLKLYRHKETHLRDKLDILQRLSDLEDSKSAPSLTSFPDPFASDEAKETIDRTATSEVQRAKAKNRKRQAG